jgi:hypothetical protein
MILKLPLRAKIGPKKDFILNLNNYRNAFYFELNKAKVEYSKIVVAMLPKGNRLLASAYDLEKELARKLKALKKKHKDEPRLYEALAPKIKNQYAADIKRLEEEAKEYKIIRVPGPVHLYFNYYHGSRAAVDASNPCSIIEKFTNDALTAAGIWPDDNVKYVRKSAYEFMGVDKENPRCELAIKLAPNDKDRLI